MIGFPSAKNWLPESPRTFHSAPAPPANIAHNLQFYLLIPTDHFLYYSAKPCINISILLDQNHFPESLLSQFSFTCSRHAIQKCRHTFVHHGRTLQLFSEFGILQTKPHQNLRLLLVCGKSQPAFPEE